MNPKPPEQLTDEELRIEIAEFCGMTRERVLDQPNTYLMKFETKYGVLRCEYYSEDLTAFETCHVPNYPSDLNAMWEAEERLKKPFNKYEYWRNYIGNLRELLQADLLEFSEDWFNVAHATAKQRAIAFVKTIKEIKK